MHINGNASAELCPSVCKTVSGSCQLCTEHEGHKLSQFCKPVSRMCPIRYRTRHFFNNSNTNEDIVWTQMVATYSTCYDVSHFLHNEVSPLQYPH